MFRMYFLTELREGFFHIHNKEKTLAFTVTFDKETFPYVWYWNTRGGDGKMHDSFALEFVSSIPLQFGGKRRLLEESVETDFTFGFSD